MTQWTGTHIEAPFNKIRIPSSGISFLERIKSQQNCSSTHRPSTRITQDRKKITVLDKKPPGQFSLGGWGRSGGIWNLRVASLNKVVRSRVRKLIGNTLAARRRCVCVCSQPYLKLKPRWCRRWRDIVHSCHFPKCKPPASPLLIWAIKRRTINSERSAVAVTRHAVGVLTRPWTPPVGQGLSTCREKTISRVAHVT